MLHAGGHYTTENDWKKKEKENIKETKSWQKESLHFLVETNYCTIYLHICY